MWVTGENVEKYLRFRRYPATCGRGISAPVTPVLEGLTDPTEVVNGMLVSVA